MVFKNIMRKKNFDEMFKAAPALMSLDRHDPRLFFVFYFFCQFVNLHMFQWVCLGGLHPQNIGVTL